MLNDIDKEEKAVTDEGETSETTDGEKETGDTEAVNTDEAADAEPGEAQEASDTETEEAEADAEESDAPEDGGDAKEEPPGENRKDDISAKGDREPEKTGFFKKKKKDKRDEKIEELEDKVRRQLAEFDNYRKRTEKEKSHMYDVGAREVIEKILPVVDNFERGLASVPEEEKDGPVMEGMNKIYRQLMDALTAMGVEPIEAEGCEFDPNLHNAVMHVEDEELGENVVAQEFQKGYKYKDMVVRHSMVKVAN